MAVAATVGAVGLLASLAQCQGLNGEVFSIGMWIANFGAELFLPARVQTSVLNCHRDFHSMSLASPQSAALAELKAFCDSLSFPATAHDVSAFMALFRCLETDLSMGERSEVEQLVQRYFHEASWVSV